MMATLMMAEHSRIENLKFDQPVTIQCEYGLMASCVFNSEVRVRGNVSFEHCIFDGGSLYHWRDGQWVPGLNALGTGEKLAVSNNRFEPGDV